MNQAQHQYKDELKNLALDYDKLKMDSKPYYPPGNLVYEMMIPKELLKKNEGLK